MVRERQGENPPESWLAQAASSGIQKLTGFAHGIVEDQTVVPAALSRIWSDG
jgi:hypothetical protein